MLAAVTKSPGVMVLDDVAEPGPPGPEDVILQPEVVGICGSDLHMYSGEVAALSGARSFFPRIQGHELCAVIAETGSDCPRGLRAGDRVAVWPLRGCRRCYPAHRDDIAALLTHRFPLTRVREAIECAAGCDSGVVKVLITVSDHNASGGIRHE